MLHKIISYSIKNKLIIGLFIISLIGWGSYQVTQLPIDAVPDITDNQVQIITVSPSLGATDIERLVTFPIEQACSNIPGSKQIRSFSRFGLSLITIVFEDNIDIYWARQQINEKLQKVQQEIPLGTGTPELAPVSTGLGEIFQYVVRSKKGFEGKFDPMQLRTIQDWIVRRQLIGTPGVAEVASFGGKLKQYEIAVKQDQLKAYHLSISDIFTALEKNNQNTGGAYIEKGPTVLYIRSEGLTSSIADIEKIVVKQMQNGTPLLIRDIAKVQFGSAIRYGAMTFNDEGEVAGAVVMMLKGENASLVVKRVKEKIEAIQKMLPDGVIIEPFLDRTKMVNNAISTVETNLMEGALIVLFVLVFLLGNLRAGLIVASVIPLAMLFAIILMNLFGVGGNLMSLGAIDFGLIVDGSVIVIEAILHRFTHSKHFRSLVRIEQNQMDEEVEKSTGSMIKSAVFSQMIILIVYLPILSLQGIEGKMFKPMAYTIAFAILGAFILSITYVPMMAALFLNKKISHKKSITDKFMEWLERRYQPFLKRVLKFPKMILGSTLLLFILSIFLLTQMGGEFIPQLEEGDFAVETRVLTGSNLNNTIESTQKASKLLLQHFPEVQKIVTKIGSAEIPTDPMPFEAADMMVILKNKKEWTSANSFAELSAKMTKVLEQVPGITVGFQFPVQMRFNELMTGARQDVVCKIFGENLDTLTKYAHQVNEIIQTVQGAINIYEEKVTGMPQVVIKYDREGMAKYGLNVADINRVVNTAFAGQSAGQVYEEEKRFDMVVRLENESRKSMADIQNLSITTSNGTQIPLSYVASIDEIEGVNQIQRENTKRRIMVGFNINGKDVQTIVNELKNKIDQKLNFQKGYTIVYGGSFENMTAAKNRLSIVVPIALFLIFLLLYFAFGSVKQGLLIYTAIPLSAMGGIFALWIRSMPFSISAGVGFIALFGVAVLNGILLVTEFNRLKAEGWQDIIRIVIHATKSKLRALLMTALVPALGFIPMAISTGAGGEVQKPLATVVIGGLIFSTLLTLFVLPLMYILFEKGRSYFNQLEIEKLKLKHKKNSSLLSVSIVVLLFSGWQLQAQSPINLKNAIDSGLKNNTSFKMAAIQVDYANSLKKSSLDFEKTAINAGYGKINSYHNDNLISIAQNFEFPSVYKNQAAIVKTNIEISELSKIQKGIELKASIKKQYFQLILLQHKKILLQQADSIYSAFLKKVNQRFDAGGTDILEKITAENQLAQINHQRQALNNGYQILLQQFQLLINCTQLYQPKETGLMIDLSVLPDIYSLNSIPLLQLQDKNIDQAINQFNLEKSKLKPSIAVGYNSGTIIGWQTTTQNNEAYYGSGQRFNAVNVGLAVPLFSTAQRAKIFSKNILIQQNKQEQQVIKQQITSSLKEAVDLFTFNKNMIAQFDKQMLPNADLLVQTASKKLNAGEISYLEWVLLINQSIQIKSEYFSYIQQFNEAAIEIEKISSNN